MRNKLYYILSYVKYFIKARHFRGDGVHSPFVFALIQSVFREKKPYYTYYIAERARKKLKKNQSSIFVTDFGTKKAASRKISNIAKQSLKSKKYSQLLFRLVNYLKPNLILELGTSFGITTMYLAAVNSKSRCITIEGCPETLSVAKTIFQKNNINNIESHCANIDQKLPEVLHQLSSVDFVFFDANHQYDATVNYFYQCLNKVNEKTVFVFDDIYWSKDMTKAWNEIKSHPQVRVSIDIFQMGIVFFNQELQKEHYILRF